MAAALQLCRNLEHFPWVPSAEAAPTQAKSPCGDSIEPAQAGFVPVAAPSGARQRTPTVNTFQSLKI
jgi:hypothetical protein